MTVPNLEIAAVGAPVTRLGVSFFPVYLANRELPDIATGESSGLLVDELEIESVQALRAFNPTDRAVLLVEGEHFLGGKQNRVVNTTVLVAAGSGLEIPVSCLEQGRWGDRQAWRRSESFAPARIRALQRAAVTRSARMAEGRAGDQHRVWREVDVMLSRAVVRSDTSAAADLELACRQDPARADAVGELVERGPLPGQCGMVVARGGQMLAMDLFGAPHLLAAHWGRLVRSHYLEGPPSPEPAAPTPLSADRAMEFARRSVREPMRDVPGVGLGVEYRTQAGPVTGQMLVLDGTVIHAAFSRHPENGTRDHD